MSPIALGGAYKALKQPTAASAARPRWPQPGGNRPSRSHRRRKRPLLHSKFKHSIPIPKLFPRKFHPKPPRPPHFAPFCTPSPHYSAPPPIPQPARAQPPIAPHHPYSPHISHSPHTPQHPHSSHSPHSSQHHYSPHISHSPHSPQHPHSPQLKQPPQQQPSYKNPGSIASIKKKHYLCTKSYAPLSETE